MKPKPEILLNDINAIKRIDKSHMLTYSIEVAKHFGEAARISSQILPDFPKPENVVITGMGGSAIGGELLKDYSRSQAPCSIEISRDYTLPFYAKKKTLVLIISYSGDTEESLSAFLDAQQRGCMTYCVSSGGALLQYAEKLNVPYLRIPAGMPPRAASPYLLVPQLMLAERLQLISGVSAGLEEARKVLEKVSLENAPEKPIESNISKSLASEINRTIPVVYGFGFYRGVALRWKQQFNENSKIPAKWEVFPELNHNEIVGWESAGRLGKYFSTIFLRDDQEPSEVRSRIEITKELMPAVSKKFEVRGQGKSMLAKMLSAILVGDFTSIYLAVLRGVDPTPVKTISTLKSRLGEAGTKERIIRELEKLKSTKS